MDTRVTSALAIGVVALFPITAVGAQNAVTEEKCKGVAYAFHKLAELRDAGKTSGTAIELVEDRLNSYNHTGSHLKSSHKEMLRPIATLVYKRSDLGPVVLGAFGLSACRVEVAFANDEAKRADGLARILDAAGKCQAKHGGGATNRAASQCVMSEWEAVRDGRSAP
jgi:hypothetical protein